MFLMLKFTEKRAEQLSHMSGKKRRSENHVIPCFTKWDHMEFLHLFCFVHTDFPTIMKSWFKKLICPDVFHPTIKDEISVDLTFF